MKKLLTIMLAACLLLAMTACGGSGQDSSQDADQAAQETEVTEETGTAGSNIPLKDNAEEAGTQIEAAMKTLLEDSYGDKVDDVRIKVEKIYTAEDEQANDILKSENLSPDEVAFEVSYDLHPAEGVDTNELLAGNGELDEESGWVVNKFSVGILRPAEDGSYTVTDFGTGW